MHDWLKRRKVASIALCMGFLLSTMVHGQGQQTPPAKTRIEAFDAQSGTVVVQGFSKVGEMKGIYGGVLTVQSMEFRDATTGRKEYGISIDVEETDRVARSLVDYEEIESILKGIDYLAKLEKSSTKLDDFQADYRTKGELRISTFSNGKEIMTRVTSGSVGATSLFLKVVDLPKLRTLLTTAKAKIDSIKTP